MEGGHSHTSATTIILGRPFLKTTQINIDVHAGKLTMEFSDLTDSNTNFPCDLCCDPSICSKCDKINKFLTIHCEESKIGFEMELSAESDYTDATENSILVFTVQQISLEEKQRLLVIHVDDDNLEENATVFSCLRFRRHPPTQLPPPPKVTPVPLSTTPRPSNQPFHHMLRPIDGPLPLSHHSS